jgi:hypothetical protein
MNMAFIIGIENGIEKGFTEDDLRLVSGPGMCVLAMVTGVGTIGGKEGRRTTHISVQEAHDRFTVALEGLDLFKEQEPVKETMTLDFVQRMADAGWSCNVGNESREEFLYKIAGQVMNKLLSKTNTETFGRNYHPTPWNYLQSQRSSVRHFIGAYLSGEDEAWYLQENVDTMIMEFNLDEYEPFYGDKYLHWDEAEDTYKLVDTLPKEGDEGQ